MKLKPRPINQYSLDGEFIKEHDSITSAAEEIGGHHSIQRIYECCVGIKASYKKCIWEYAQREMYEE